MNKTINRSIFKQLKKMHLHSCLLCLLILWRKHTAPRPLPLVRLTCGGHESERRSYGRITRIHEHPCTLLIHIFGSIRLRFYFLCSIALLNTHDLSHSLFTCPLIDSFIHSFTPTFTHTRTCKQIHRCKQTNKHNLSHTLSLLYLLAAPPPSPLPSPICTPCHSLTRKSKLAGVVPVSSRSF